MKKILLFVSASFFFSYLSCLQEESNPFKYPRVTTTPIGDITPKGARFSATVEFEKIDQISGSGFLWGEDSKLSTKTFILSSDTLTGNLFYTDVRSSLVENKTYYVRSFVKESGKTLYGNIVSFKSLGSEGPKITGLNPQVAAFGDTIEVLGKNFTTKAVLKYGERDISFSMLGANKNKLTFILPDSLPVTPSENFISLSVEGNITNSPAPLKLDLDRILPKITSIKPSIVKACDTVTLIGANLVIKGHEMKAKVWSNSDELVVLKATEHSIVCVLKKIPKDDLHFSVYNGLYFSSSQGPDIKVQRPEIISVSPLIYKSKDVITVKVKNFPYCDNSMYARITNDYSNLEILSKSKDEIVLRLPEGCLGSFAIVFTLPSDFYLQGQEFQTPQLSPQPPEIVSIEPSHGSLGDEIIIKGKNLRGATIDMLDTISTGDTQIRGRLNEFAMIKENGFVDVQINNCGFAIKENGFKYDPIEILDFNPKIITSPSQQITITGKNFSSAPHLNKITIGSYISHQSSDDHRTITIAAGALIGNVSHSINESDFITIENGMGKQTITLTPLAINYEASWVNLSDVPFNGVYLGISFSIGNYGYTGSNGNSPLWQYDPAVDTWEEKAVFPGHASGYRVSIPANGKAYVGLDSDYNQEWWQYDPTINVWVRKKDYPGSYAGGAVGFEIGGKVYVGGGSGTSFNYEFWEYNPATDSWTRKTNIPARSGRHTPNFGFNGKGYIYGNLEGGQYAEMVYDPDSDSWTSRSVQSFENGTNYSYMIFRDYVIFGGEPLNYYAEDNVFYKVIPGSSEVMKADYIGGIRKGQTGFAIGDYGYWGLGIDPPDFIRIMQMWRFDPSRFR